jgi:hypothetical protein
MTREEYAKLEREYKQLMAEPIPKAKPKPKPAVVAVVSEKAAAAVRANPESVRVSARASDDTIVVDRPRRSEVLEVLEVDAEGRPRVARSFDAATGAWSIVEFDQGYRRSGVQHDYVL